MSLPFADSASIPDEQPKSTPEPNIEVDGGETMEQQQLNQCQQNLNRSNILGFVRPPKSNISRSFIGPMLPKNARIMFTLPATNAEHLIKLEVISSRETAYIRAVETFAGLYNIIYLVIVTCLARNRWSDDPSCNSGICDRRDFRIIVWYNFISVTLFTAVAFLFSLYYIYLARFRVKRYRPEVLWAMILLLPTVVFNNNPALNFDRIQIFGVLGGTGASILAVFRYATSAFAIAAVTLYQILKFGSLDRSASLHDAYQHSFYPLRVVPIVLLLIGFFVTSLKQKTELSPQPFVSLVSFARKGNSEAAFTKSTIAAVVTVGLLQLSLFGVFLLRYWKVSKRVTRRSYQETRFKAMSVFFLFRHMIIPLTLAAFITSLCAALLPTHLTYIRRSRGKLTERFVLDMPYYARSGIVLVYCAYACIESFVMLPASYKPTFLERLLISRLGMQAGAALAPADQGGMAANVSPSSPQDDLQPMDGTILNSGDALTGSTGRSYQTRRSVESGISPVSPLVPVVLQVARDQNGHVVRGPTLFAQFRFDETVLAFNLSWLTYFSDADIISSALAEHGSGQYSLRRVWQEPARDLFVITVSSPEMIIVVFRGSVSMTNLKLDLQMTQSPHRPLTDPDWLQGRWKPPRWGVKYPAIHKGFDIAYNSMREGILDDIKTALHEIPDRRVFLTGHSLGAAFASLCAFDCRVTLGVPEDCCTLITFGSPRVGNQSFARRFAIAVPDCWRVLNRRDFITNNPRRFLRGYEHVPRGVLIDESGNLVLDPMFADLKLFHGNAFHPHVMEAYKRSLQAFLTQAYGNRASGGDNSDEQQYEPSWWDFSKYEGQHSIQRHGIQEVLESE